MTCPQRVSDALASLPWVDADSIKADRATRQAKFRVKDRKHFNLEEVQLVISKAGYPTTKLLTGPQEK
ncbi:MAG TPA: hypothetical protein VLM40_07580 [Gemmata sp.]|nr:hypothetical protein [Gemmata sp.]